MNAISGAYVYALMHKAQSEATPWQDKYQEMADVIAKEANASPLFLGDDGPAQTAALAVAVMKFESSMKPDAQGDCEQTDDRGMCVVGSTPHSFCAFQVNDSNFKALGVTAHELLGDFAVCAHTGFRMMRTSFRLCSGPEWKLEDRLNHYHLGGAVCRKSNKGPHRIRLGQWLYQNVAKPTS